MSTYNRYNKFVGKKISELQERQFTGDEFIPIQIEDDNYKIKLGNIINGIKSEIVYVSDGRVPYLTENVQNVQPETLEQYFGKAYKLIDAINDDAIIAFHTNHHTGIVVADTKLAYNILNIAYTQIKDNLLLISKWSVKLGNTLPGSGRAYYISGDYTYWEVDVNEINQILDVLKIDGNGDLYLADDGEYKDLKQRFVDLISEQNITGLKTFEVNPKSIQDPTEDDDLTNKKYVDSVASNIGNYTVNGYKISSNPVLTKNDIGLSNVTNDTQVKRSEMGVAGGVATLDDGGKIPSEQLPSYVDDVIEGYYVNQNTFNDEDGSPVTLIKDVIYVDINTNKSYRYTGTSLIEITSGPLFADEEDIHKSSDGKLSFKDREYDPEQFSGKGYKILRKNIQDGKNILTQDMINESNTIYEIRYDFDLNSTIINLPNNCVLKFEGGSFNNGVITSKNGYVCNVENKSNSIIFNGIIIKTARDAYGFNFIFNTYAHSLWFSEDDYILYNSSAFLGLYLEQDLVINIKQVAGSIYNVLNPNHPFILYGNNHTVTFNNDESISGYSGISSTYLLEIYNINITLTTDNSYSILRADNLIIKNSNLISKNRIFVSSSSVQDIESYCKYYIENCKLLTNQFAIESNCNKIDIVNSYIDNEDYTQLVRFGSDKISISGNKELIGILNIYNSTLIGGIECINLDKINITNCIMSHPSAGLRGTSEDYNTSINYINCIFKGFTGDTTCNNFYCYIKNFRNIYINNCIYDVGNFQGIFENSTQYPTNGILSIQDSDNIDIKNCTIKASEYNTNWVYPNFGIVNSKNIILDNNTFIGYNNRTYVIYINNPNNILSYRKNNIDVKINLGDRGESSIVNNDNYINILFNTNTYGTNEPTFNKFIGGQFFNNTENRPKWWNGTNWIYSDGIRDTILYIGTFSQKPNILDGIPIGFAYYCTDITTADGNTGLMIYHKGNDVWMDGDGNIITDNSQQTNWQIIE